MTSVDTRTRTGSMSRIEGVDKVTGDAKYAFEYPVEGAVYGWPVLASIARGRVAFVGREAAVGRDGVIEVLWHANAPRLHDIRDALTDVLQKPDVAFRGQVVALVVATTQEGARETAERLEVSYDEEPHDVLMTEDHAGLYTPDSDEMDTATGDFEAAFGTSPVTLDLRYTTPAEHNNPMEPHATTALWDGDRLTVWDANQGGESVRQTLARLFQVAPADVRVVSAHVGGGFGAKGTPRPNVVLATMAARVVGRPVRLALTRHHQFCLVGYRSPTIQRIRLGADESGVLNAIAHDTVAQCATVKEFPEMASVVSRVMYAAPHRRTSHLLAALDVPIPSWMRAPGECPGAFALESAMDELAVALEIDPIELRVRNEPNLDPEQGIPFSSRHLIECMRSGGERFGWDERSSEPGSRREGRWLVGLGMAASTYPVNIAPATARVAVDADGRYTVSINATDIGTGARTALLQVAADALEADPSDVTILIGDTRLPRAGIAGGSMGMNSWGWAVQKASAHVREQVAAAGGAVPADGIEVTADTAAEVKGLDGYSRHAFGAQFVEAHVDVDTGEIRVPRMVGVFAAGRIVNAVTARSQFIGGMTMGLSMALHEEGLMDGRFGDYANHDLASYHIAANADVGEIEVSWIDEDDRHLGSTGTKGIGEIGIVGTAAAIANAVYNATRLRLRDLPLHLEDVLAGLGDLPAR